MTNRVQLTSKVAQIFCIHIHNSLHPSSYYLRLSILESFLNHTYYYKYQKNIFLAIISWTKFGNELFIDVRSLLYWQMRGTLG